ncbi:MAG: sugar ABC transporter ATP-binding protein [Rhodobacteraceae bacterium]|nr:sugar ABC transporter ATP-binding protein [Paracoccaceae bacterium]
MKSAPILSLRGINRLFGPVQVLFDTNIELHTGEVHALIGENGAGKSTTMKIMSGYLPPSSGDIFLNGAVASFASSQAAEAAGIVLIHQEFNLAEDLTVEENIFLGKELRRGLFLDKAAMRAGALALLERLHSNLDPAARVKDISNPDKQMVEIAKALGRKAQVLIMDEPTAVLTNREAEILFEQVERLKAEGTALLFTSHKLDEVKRISDKITIMRDGRVVASGPTSDFSEDQMAEAMVGREMSSLYPVRKGAFSSKKALEVTDFSVPGHAQNINFTLHKGEILGVSGLIGSGRTELMEGLIGLRRSAGHIAVNGKTVAINSPRQAQDLGICYLTEDRKTRGLLLNMGLKENLTLQSLPNFSHILLDKPAEERALDAAIKEFDIRAPSRRVKVVNLSGGNQQKLLIAKTMLADPQIIIIDEPTRGIDIGTKQQIYELIHALAGAGKSVIVISSEMPEVIGISDRVLVMRSGALVGEVSGDEMTEDNIVRLAMGLAAQTGKGAAA